jgi:transposase
VAARFLAPAVPKRIDGDLALIDHDDGLRRDMALSLLTTAQQHDAHTLSLLRTVPGIGAILSSGPLDDIHALQRFPRGQEFVSSCRLGECAKESAGKRSGTAGTTRGHAYLQWAFSEAAGRFFRATPAGQKCRARSEQNQSQGKALTGLAHP